MWYISTRHFKLYINFDGKAGLWRDVTCRVFLLFRVFYRGLSVPNHEWNEQIDRQEFTSMPKNLWHLHHLPEVGELIAKQPFLTKGVPRKNFHRICGQWLMAMQLSRIQQTYNKHCSPFFCFAFFFLFFRWPCFFFWLRFLPTGFSSFRHRWGGTVWHEERWRCQSIPCWRVRRSLVPFVTWQKLQDGPLPVVSRVITPLIRVTTPVTH